MRITIIGCGTQGSELAKVLSLDGCGVTVVDSDQSAFLRLGSSFRGQVIQGNGMDRDVLVKGGAEQADGMAVVTASDEVNIVIARVAREVLKVPRVVARVHDPHKAEIYQRLGLMTVTPVMLGTQRFREQLTFLSLAPVKRLGNGEVGIIEIEIPPGLVGRTVNELTVPGEIQVTAITRGNKTEIPVSGAVFHEKDIIHVAVESGSVNRLRTFLGIT